MVVLREMARHITRGLEIVGAQCAETCGAPHAVLGVRGGHKFRAGIHNDRGFGSDFRGGLGQGLQEPFEGLARLQPGVSASKGDA